MTLLINMKEISLVKILMMKKHQVKLKQIWIAEIKFNALNHPIQRDSDEDMYAFSYLRSIMNLILVFIAKSAF